jgi:hypothetical protein
MDREPVVIDEGTREWKTWPDEEVAARGLVYWKTLLSADLTHSEALTMGIAKILPAEALHEHRHRRRDLSHPRRNRLGPDRRQGAARRSGVGGLHPGQRRALLREYGSIGSTVHLRFPGQLVRGRQVRLR